MTFKEQFSGAVAIKVRFTTYMSGFSTSSRAGTNLICSCIHTRSDKPWLDAVDMNSQQGIRKQVFGDKDKAQNKLLSELIHLTHVG